VLYLITYFFLIILRQDLKHNFNLYLFLFPKKGNRITKLCNKSLYFFAETMECSEKQWKKKFCVKMTILILLDYLGMLFVFREGFGVRDANHIRIPWRLP